MNVLIVDDEPIVTRLLTKIVSNLGYTVDAYNDPDEALQSYTVHHHPIALINWLMPGMNGIEMTKRIRSMKHGKETSILIVSALDVRRHMDEFLESGADDFVGKPVDVDLLNIRMAIARRNANQMQLRRKSPPKR